MMTPMNNNRQSQCIRFNYNGATGSGFYNAGNANNRSTAVTFGRGSQQQQ